MGLPPDLRDRLAAALSKNRVATLCRLVREIAAHNLDRDTRIRHRYKMRSAHLADRGAVLQRGFLAARLVSDLGDAMCGSRLSGTDVIDRVEELCELDQITADAVSRSCDEAIIGTTE